MRRIAMIILLGLLLGGCAFRGALKVDCANFASRVHPVPITPLERQIRGRDWEPDAARDAEMAGLLAAPQLERLRSDEAFLRASAGAGRPTLLLSGGGQWGAFGVGLMNQLIDDGKFPDFAVVTGVSTGALQALFVGAGMDRPGPEGAAMRAALAEAYSPAREDDIVDRESNQALAALTGALANLGPLRRRFEERICPQIYAPDTSAGRAGACAVRELRDNTSRRVFLGMIEANSGEFGFVDVQELLKPYGDTPKELSEATQCLAGAAIASAAVPVFYQQVRVDGRTYYDGGVRQSVFLTALVQAQRQADALVRQERLRLLGERGLSPPAELPAFEPPPLYVIRNGPTLLGPEEKRYMDYPTKLDTHADALNAAMRAEAIMVNQLEVGSVAALRLSLPGGTIYFTSADGWATYTSRDNARCGPLKENGPRGAMFIPAFMRCIMDYGKTRAINDPWDELCRYDGTETRPFCSSPGEARRPRVEN